MDTNQKTYGCVMGQAYVPEPIEWLWDGYLPTRGLVILAGEQGTGKTTFAIDIAARLSSGQNWIDGSENLQKASVYIWSEEDSICDTLMNRFKVAGGDIDMAVHTISKDMKGVPMPNLLEGVLGYVKTNDIKLVIIDPIISLVSGDSNHVSDVRTSLNKLVNFSMENNVVFLGITHYSKKGLRGESVGLDKVLGSQVFTALPRVVLTIDKQKDGTNRFTICKNNIGTIEGKEIYFSIEESVANYEELDASYSASKIVNVDKEAESRGLSANEKLARLKECQSEILELMKDDGYCLSENLKPIEEKYGRRMYTKSINELNLGKTQKVIEGKKKHIRFLPDKVIA